MLRRLLQNLFYAGGLDYLGGVGFGLVAAGFWRHDLHMQMGHEPRIGTLAATIIAAIFLVALCLRPWLNRDGD